ncbi:serine hydrolase [Endozoicomonas sp. 8E]|uniref:serine hydrolase domain-containing protein n=1 Tax=Endozoicomonas sp. 8E TaxID=3035692 RepID=UPI002938E71D|nr:serine hydrolase [Endozoicomonas sp. 8E]WOG26403.1 serine hydrolase [Endozoicomonas sp. 8E]
MKKTLLAALGMMSCFTYAAMDNVPAAPEGQVTLMNWTKQPYNHWAFRNMGIHPSLMVPRSGAISVIPQALDARIPDLAFEYQGKSHTVRDAMINDSTDGFIVIHRGKTLAEEYFNGFSEHDHHLWASSTKSLVGQAMGILIKQGEVDTDAKVETYIPELKGKYIGKRTVREVLNMVTALDYSEDYENFTPGAVSTEYFRRLGFIPAFDLMATDPQENRTPRGILEYLPEFEQNSELEPGYRYEYQSPNVDVAGWIIARVSGQPLQTFIAENFWNKLGVEHDAFFMADVGYSAVATGGFNTTLRDFARVGLAMVNNGKYDGKQVFAEDWVKDTFTLTDKEREHTARSIYKDRSSAAYDEWLEGYKNFVWIHDSEKGIGTFRGIFGQHLYINREKDLVIATFSSAASASNSSRETNKTRFAAFEAIAAEL